MATHTVSKNAWHPSDRFLKPEATNIRVKALIRKQDVFAFNGQLNLPKSRDVKTI